MCSTLFCSSPHGREGRRAAANCRSKPGCSISAFEPWVNLLTMKRSQTCHFFGTWDISVVLMLTGDLRRNIRTSTSFCCFISSLKNIYIYSSSGFSLAFLEAFLVQAPTPPVVSNQTPCNESCPLLFQHPGGLCGRWSSVLWHWVLTQFKTDLIHVSVFPFSSSQAFYFPCSSELTHS